MSMFLKRKKINMEEVKYIPGDLVMTNGVPLGTAKDVVYRVTSSDQSKTLKLDDGTVLKGVVCLENIEGAEFGDKGYLSGDCCAWVKDIVPINLVPDILENGWNKSISWFYVGSEERGYQFSKELDDNWGELGMTYGDLQISQCENLRDWRYINECNHYFNFEFTYVHELQHLLYALHIDSNLKI